MKTKRYQPLLVALVFAWSRPTSAQRPLDQSVVGCYTLSFGPWSRGRGSPAEYVPGVVRLDTTAYERAGWRLSPNIDYHGHPPFDGFPLWETSRDTLRLVWSNGLAPTTVTLVRRDSIWRGDVVTSGDIIIVGGSPEPRASATAQRRSCEGVQFH
jgi:hypothetical protein